MSRWEHLDAVVRRWALWANNDRRTAYEHVLGAIRDLKDRGCPTHAAAVSGCTGTGEEYATPEHTDEWGWCSWGNCWVQLSPEGRTLQVADELPGCTATDAVLDGGGR
jgi:hypothetical protein